jgi:hypothetical protein
MGNQASGALRAASTAPSKALGFLVASQAFFWGSIVVCYILLPDGDLRHHGISIYGNFRASIVPYSLGFAFSSFFMAFGARTLSAGGETFGVHARLTRAVAILLLALVVTPSSSSGPIVGALHTGVAITLFTCQLLLGFHLLARVERRSLVATLFVVQLIGAVASFLSLLHIVHLMFGAQSLTELAFGILLIVGTTKFFSEERAPRMARARAAAGAMT